MSDKQWDTTIVDDLCRVCNKEVEVSDFVNKYWERFKPVYISVHKYIECDSDLYMLVYKFVNKIYKSDVQPLFQSDNQLFSYFKTAVRNNKYDVEHKKELQVVWFSENTTETSEEPYEESIPNEEYSLEENVENELFERNIIVESSKVLSEPYIQVIVLLYRGYSPKEIRKILGVSYTTVRDRIGVIRKMLLDTNLFHK